MNTQPCIDPHKAKLMFTIYLPDKQFFSDLFVHGKVQLSLTFSIPSSCKLQRAYRSIDLRCLKELLVALKPPLIIFCLPTERVRIKRGVSLMLNKFLFIRLEVINCMEPFQTNLSECNRHRFYFPPPSKCLLYLQPSVLHSLQKQFPPSTFENSTESSCQHGGDIGPWA